MGDDNKIIRNLIDSTLKLNAGDAHIAMHNVNRTKDLTAVVSVYDGVKPAHIVLEELLKWADRNDSDLFERIERMQQDMSWNDQHPV